MADPGSSSASSVGSSINNSISGNGVVALSTPVMRKTHKRESLEALAAIEDAKFVTMMQLGAVEIFEFLTILELFHCLKVNKSWKKLCLRAMRDKITSVDLSQFWAAIGVKPTPLYAQFTSTFHAATSLSLAFCHHVTDEVLRDVFRSVPSRDQITRLNLFYCHRITDKTAVELVQCFPNLIFLNLGRCFLLTDSAIRTLSKLKHLRALILAYNTQFTSVMLEDLENSFAVLEYVDIRDCTHDSIKVELVEEINRNMAHAVPPRRIEGPVRINVIPPIRRKNNKT